MKILFFGKDQAIDDLAQGIKNVETSLHHELDDALSSLKELKNDHEGLIVCVLDFALGTSVLEEFNKSALAQENIMSLTVADPKDIKELRAHQKSDYACTGHLLRPLALDALETAINDFEMAFYVQEGVDIDDIPMTKLESSAKYELEHLDDDKGDYDTSQIDISALNADANQNENTQTMVSSQAESDVKMDDFDFDGPTDTQTIESDQGHDEVTQEREVAMFEDDPTHTHIQSIFDQVKLKNQSSAEENNEETPQEHSVEHKEIEVTMSDKDNKKDDIGFDLDFDEESEEKDETQEQLEAKKSEDSEATLEKAEDKDSKTEDSNEDGFEFSFGEDETTGEIDISAQAESSQPDEDKSAVNFDVDLDEGLEDSGEADSNELSMSEVGEKYEAPKEEAQQEDESTSLEFDDDEEDSEENALEVGEVGEKTEGLNAQQLEEEDDGLTFNEEGEAEAEASEINEQDQADEAEAEEENHLNFDLGGAESEQEEDDQAQDSEDTLDRVDQTINEIVAPDTEEVQAESEEEATNAFKLPSGPPENIDEIPESSESEDDDGLDFSAVDLDEADDEPEEVSDFEEQTQQTDIGVSDDSGDDEATRVHHALGESSDDGEDHTMPTMISTADLRGSSEEDLDDENDEDEDKTRVIQKAPEQDEFDIDAGFDSSDDEGTQKTRIYQAENLEGVRPLESFDEDNLTRLQATIRQLREEREENQKLIQELRNEKKLVEQAGLSEKAELDELRIEISILKKRHKAEVEELKYQYKLSEEKKQIYEERCRNYQKEFERLNNKVRLEFNQVKQREKELESQLELMSMDSQAQVQSRDSKILELKRKIDSLEFNMENVSIREEKSREDKAKLEDRLNKIMSTLRGSIKVLEDDEIDLDTAIDNDSEDKLKG